jgi:hypothetical protein
MLISEIIATLWLATSASDSLAHGAYYQAIITRESTTPASAYCSYVPEHAAPRLHDIADI